MKGVNLPGGKAMMFDPRVARLQKMRKTVYNAGMGIEADVASTGVEHTCWFFTLTYKNVDDWRPQHVRDYLKRLRVYLYRKGLPLRYVWVAELQRRGAVHYHILIWLPRGVVLPKSDTRGWWPYGFTQQVKAKKRVGYLMKYASKQASSADHSFPKGCRIYGFGGVSTDVKRRVRWWRAPTRVRRYFTEIGKTFLTVDLRKVVGGWVDNLTGTLLESNWRMFLCTRKKLVFYMIEDPGVWNVQYLREFALEDVSAS